MINRWKLRPFSHREGAQCMLPGTDLIVEAFPHRLRVGLWEMPLDGTFLERPFTLQQDVQNFSVHIFGPKFHAKIVKSEQGFVFEDRKRKETIDVTLAKKFLTKGSIEELSLGSHKVQDWDRILQRMDLRDILPILYSLSQTMNIEKKTLFQPPLKQELLHWIYTSFHQILVPKVAGNVWEEAFGKIRSLFILENGNCVTLLQDPLFALGQMKNVQIQVGKLGFEWSQKRLKTVIVHGEKEGELVFAHFRFCRVREDLQKRGKTHDFSKAPLLVTSGKTLFLDRFQ